MSKTTKNIYIPLAKGANLSGNIAEKVIEKSIPGAFVDELYKQFRYSLIGIHRKTKEEAEYFKSPVSGERYNSCHVSAYNLTRKTLFRMEYVGNSSDFTKEWINYIQKC